MIFESELKIMNILWTYGDNYASEIAKEAMKSYGWNKNTTYTIINKLIEKGYIKRSDPKFFCTALIQKDQEQLHATNTLIEKLFQGSISSFFSHFVKSHKLSQSEVDKLLEMIEKSKD